MTEITVSMLQSVQIAAAPRGRGDPGATCVAKGARFGVPTPGNRPLLPVLAGMDATYA